MFKTVVLHNIFYENCDTFFGEFFSEWKVPKNRIFEIEIFCNIINIFTVTFLLIQNILME